MAALAHSGADIPGRVDGAIARAVDAVLARQASDGGWPAVLVPDPTLDAELIILQHVLRRVRPDTARRLAEQLLQRRTECGSFGTLRQTILACLALKLAGHESDAPALAHARATIHAAGGLACADTATRRWLACAGQFPWPGVTTVPVELIMLRAWMPFSIHRVACRMRSTLVALMLLSAHHPRTHLPPEMSVADLWLEPPDPLPAGPPAVGEPLSGRRLLLAGDRLMKGLGYVPLAGLHRRAVARAIEWLLHHQGPSGRWASAARPTMVAVVALHGVGFALDHPVMVRACLGLEALQVERDGRLGVAREATPVPATVGAAEALLAADLPPSHPALARATGWLLEAQGREPGDWAELAPRLQPGGIGLEPGERWAPHAGVTARACGVLRACGAPAPAAAAAAAWTAGMQSWNGGWAPQDVNNTSRLWDQTALAEDGRVTDPPDVETTGAVMEMLGASGQDRHVGRTRRGVDFLRSQQHADGHFAGADPVAATAAALTGLVAVGEPSQAPAIRAGVEWLAARPLAGLPPATVAAVVRALLATDGARHPAVAAGVATLLDAQAPDGTWSDGSWAPVVALGMVRRGRRT